MKSKRRNQGSNLRTSTCLPTTDLEVERLTDYAIRERADSQAKARDFGLLNFEMLQARSVDTHAGKSCLTSYLTGKERKVI